MTRSSESRKFSKVTARGVVVGLLTAGFALGLFSPILIGCSGPSLRPSERNAREREEEKATQEIEMLHETGAHQTALRWVDAFMDRYPKGTRRARVLYVKGLSLRELVRLSESISVLESAADLAGGDFTLKARILLARAQSEYLDARYRTADSTLKEIDPAHFSALDRSRFLILRARVLLARDYFVDAARDMIDAVKASAEEASRSLVVMEDALAGVESIEDLKSLQMAAEVTAFGELILYRQGERLLEMDRFDEAQSVFRNYLVRFPRSARSAEVRSILNRRKQGVVVDSRIVGVLVPKSGKWASIGARVLKAIEMGIPANTRKLIPVVEDSGETPEQLMAALDRLVFERRAIAVLGPVTTKGIALAAQRAQETGVPMVTLSRKEAPDYDFVFQAGLTLELQIRTMVAKAMNDLGMKRFGILFPADALGRLAADTFWDEVESRGGVITAVESYSPEETDFRAAIDQMTGFAWSSSKKSTTTVDFDAVFVPDSGAVAAKIFPTFRFRDVDNMNFLGLSVWNSSDFVKRVGAGVVPKVEPSPSPSVAVDSGKGAPRKGQEKGQEKSKVKGKGKAKDPAPAPSGSPAPAGTTFSATEAEEGDSGALNVAKPVETTTQTPAAEPGTDPAAEIAIPAAPPRKPEHRFYFVDTFSATSMSSSLRRFMEAFKKQTKAEATSLEVQCLDSTRILFQAIDGLGSEPSRDGLQGALTKMQNLDGLSGRLGYSEGYLIGEPRLLTVSKGAILFVKGQAE